MKTTDIRNLEREIERLVREHVAACKAAAEAAVERGFDSALSARPKATKSKGAKNSKTSKSRRTAQEMAELGEQFYQAVCAKPGETMRVLCVEIGATPRELNRPMNALKREGRLRTIGERFHTRYFPMVSDS